MREVLRLGNPTLREVAEPVEDHGSPEVTALVADLGDTLAPAGLNAKTVSMTLWRPRAVKA